MQSIIIAAIGVISGAVAIGMMLEARHVDVLSADAVFLVVIVAICARAARSGITTSEAGVRVMNVFSTIDLSWSEIRRFDVGRSGIFPLVCLIHLNDGGVMRAFGIQERTNFPNGSAEQMADELNQELRDYLTGSAVASR